MVLDVRRQQGDEYRPQLLSKLRADFLTTRQNPAKSGDEIARLFFRQPTYDCVISPIVNSAVFCAEQNGIGSSAHSDRNDLKQIALLGLLSYLRNTRGVRYEHRSDGDFEGWIYTVLYRKITNHFRDKPSESPQASLSPDHWQEYPDNRGAPFGERLVALIEGRFAGQQRAVLRSWACGCAKARIARSLGLHESRVRRLIEDGTRRLRDYLDDDPVIEALRSRKNLSPRVRAEGSSSTTSDSAE